MMTVEDENAGAQMDNVLSKTLKIEKLILPYKSGRIDWVYLRGKSLLSGRINRSFSRQYITVCEFSLGLNQWNNVWSLVYCVVFFLNPIELVVVFTEPHFYQMILQTKQAITLICCLLCDSELGYLREKLATNL